MNCISLNIICIGFDAKVIWVRKLKAKNKANFIGIQEIRVLDYSKINVNEIWDSMEFDFEGVDVNGKSGGLISIWNMNYFNKKIKVLMNRFYLILIGTWIGIARNTIFANIYGLQTPMGKKELWKELLQIKRA